MNQEKIGILTGGGDCSGLNSAIKSITQVASIHKFKVIGIRDGWKGLSCCDAIYKILNNKLVDQIDYFGGTILGTSRTNPYVVTDGIKNLLINWKKLNLSALVVIGGEDTLGIASRLFNEHRLPIIGIPKTIDFDVPDTEYSLGFESSLNVITSSIDNIKSTAESHSRVFIVEVMGRNAGYLALFAGMSTGAQIVLIPEVDFEINRISNILIKRKKEGYRHSIVIVAESAKAKGNLENLLTSEMDQFGHVRFGGIGNWLAGALARESSLECRSIVLGHLQRGGTPTAYDRRMGFMFGSASIQAIRNKSFGSFISLFNGEIVLKPLSKLQDSSVYLNLSKYYNSELYCPKYVYN